ncbi:MAG: hypothetical protein HYY06_03540 [Deltaproteobacteria bacterium]|nr:hypothetical protein [Deltaproteobacteria bacterium]
MSNSDLLDTVLLFALPASGKSEIRTYLAGLSPARCREDFHVGPTLQLDDYPYVHLMHRIDDLLAANGHRAVFYKGPARPFQDDWEWAALIELLNEDYDDLLAGRATSVPSAAELLFDRLDRAHAKVGLPEAMGELPHRIRRRVGQALEAECAAELDSKNRTCSEDRIGKTIVIEAARGGPNGAAFPLTPPVGYESAFRQLSERVLERAVVLYVWVDPAESRRKNIERGKPDGQGSILHHSVPAEVMLAQYGCDDMDHLIRTSDRPGTIRVDRVFASTPDSGARQFRARTFHVPVARFDNRKDKTTFVRTDRASWRSEEVDALHGELRTAFSALEAARRENG